MKQMIENICPAAAPEVIVASSNILCKKRKPVMLYTFPSQVIIIVTDVSEDTNIGKQIFQEI